MAIEFENTEPEELSPKIAVIGVGGAGCNAVNNMINSGLKGVDFVVANTDAQSLHGVSADNRLQLGVEVTRGLGAGAQPKVGEAAAEESTAAIEEILDGYHMAFVAAGMGGGTGTGASPVVARIARDKGILTVGVVTKPFMFEGGRRMKIADAGIKELAQHVDTLIIIPNQNLFNVANERTTFAEAFKMADDVLHSGVRSITDLMVMPGLINLDFADVRTVMSEMGKAMMGTGEAEGDGRARLAAEEAISNQLLEDASLKGAKGVIINVAGGMDMTLYEVDEAVSLIKGLADEDALIVFGSAYNESLDGKLRVSVVATGIDGGPAPAGEKLIKSVADTVKEQAEINLRGSNVASAANAISPVEEEAVVPASDVVVSINEKLPEADAQTGDRSTGHEQAREHMTGVAADDFTPDNIGKASENNKEVDPVSVREELALEVNDALEFIVEEAMTPEGVQAETELGDSDVFKDADYTNGTARQDAVTETVKTPSSQKSFFQKVTSRFSAEQKNSIVDQMGTGVTNDRSTVGGGGGNPGAESPSLGGLTDADRPAPKREGTDQMEIPAFLKRQQN